MVLSFFVYLEFNTSIVVCCLQQNHQIKTIQQQNNGFLPPERYQWDCQHISSSSRVWKITATRWKPKVFEPSAMGFISVLSSPHLGSNSAKVGESVTRSAMGGQSISTMDHFSKRRRKTTHVLFIFIHCQSNMVLKHVLLLLLLKLSLTIINHILTRY